MHVKRQYAMILAQGFQMGMNFQKDLFNQAIRKAQEEHNAGAGATLNDEQKDGESK